MNESVFDGKGTIYAQFRPTYPRTLLDYLRGNLGVNSRSIIADIGSGTGILTQLLLDNFGKVLAVEPNHDMRMIAEARLNNACGFTSINGTAENTTLLDHSVDFITVAQAFHWFNRLIFKRECKRVLKSNGKVVLIWNCRDENSSFVQETNMINGKYCPNFKGLAGGMRGARNEDDFIDFFDGIYETNSFSNNLVFNEQGFIGLHQSASYAPMENDNSYMIYITELKELFDKYSNNGEVIMQNFTRCYAGKV